MSLFHCKRSQLLVANVGLSVINSSTHLGCTQNYVAFTIRLLSSYPEQNQQSNIVSYLISSCGLSPESAKSVFKRVDFITPDRVDYVLSLLKGYGFTIAHISRVIKKRPQILTLNPGKTLLPKLEFLCSIGVSRSALPGILCCNPDLLRRSLHSYLIPNYNVLKTILGSDEEIVKSLKRSYRFDPSKNFLAANIAFLRNVSIPQQIISCLLTRSPNIMGFNPNKFGEIVNKAIDLGFDPSKHSFLRMVQLMSQTSQQTREQKMEAHKCWGSSEDEIGLAIRKGPIFMLVSVNKFNSVMEFLVNKVGCKPAEVVRCPEILKYSLAKRIIPRFSVIRVLQLKGLVKADVSVASVIIISEKRFLDAYVIKYLKEIPQLLSILKGKMRIDELGYAFEAEKHVPG